jgi:choice-of-anchor B domain-containing protein
MTLRAPAVALVVLLLAGCGRDSSPTTPVTAPVTTPSAPPGGARAENMVLRSRLDLPTLTGQPGATGAGNYGYTSPGGRRFALTGTSLGLSIVEVTDPRNPRNAAFIPAAAPSSWREVRTYGEYVYSVTEARIGMEIVSMRNPDRPERVQTWSRTFQSAHSLWIDQERGLLFANGSDGRTGGVRILDLRANPADPTEVGSFNGFYVHDSYTRGTTLYAAAISDGFLGILDASNPANVFEITRFFTGGRFTHNAWLTRDGRYVFTTDERFDRPVEGWDLQNPLAPRKVAEYIGGSGSIPHNVLVDGDRLLIAHYTEGVHLLDVRNPERPVRLGSYDTYDGPACASGFCGCWGAYIFPGSNLIVASDISGGLSVIEYTGP